MDHNFGVSLRENFWPWRGKMHPLHLRVGYCAWTHFKVKDCNVLSQNQAMPYWSSSFGTGCQDQSDLFTSHPQTLRLAWFSQERKSWVQKENRRHFAEKTWSFNVFQLLVDSWLHSYSAADVAADGAVLWMLMATLVWGIQRVAKSMKDALRADECSLRGGRVPESSILLWGQKGQGFDQALLFKTCGVRHSFSRYHHLHPHYHLPTWSWMGWRLDQFRKLTVQDWPTRIYWSACIQSKVACLTVENSRLISQKTLCLA